MAASAEPASPLIRVVVNAAITDASADLPAALRDSLGHITALDFGETTPSEEDAQLLDKPGHEASAADIADWLGRCEVRWQETDNPEGTKEALVLALRPRFNRQVPKPRRRLLSVPASIRRSGDS